MQQTNYLEYHPRMRNDLDAIPVLTRWVGSWHISLHRRPFSSDELRRSYDRESCHWARKIDRLGMVDAYEDVLREAIEDAPMALAGANRRVLDCGVGTGAFSAALASMLPGPFQLEAVDLSPRMLDQAGDRLSRLGLVPRLHLADARELPFEDNTFDLVMSAHMLEHLVEPAGALQEMTRVLKPGGQLVVCCTRRSLLGIPIQLKWRTHAVTPALVADWFAVQGLEHTRHHTPPRHRIFDGLSIAYTGKKPSPAPWSEQSTINK